MAPASIFISYSRQDMEWMRRVETHLSAIGEAWSDQRIGAGKDWSPELHAAIESARIAVLLVSADFLASEFIMKEEVPRLLQRREQGLIIIPLLIRSCAWDKIDWLNRIELFPRNGSALSARPEAQVDEELANLAREIHGLLETPGSSEPTRTPALNPFLELLRERVNRADWDENWAASPDAPWSPEQFIDLEAEVQFESQQGTWHFLSPAAGGIRRERHVSRALARSKEKFIILEGAPGSGKSVALRQVARSLLDEALRALRSRSKHEIQIPLYLSLRSFRPQGAIDAEAVHNFVRQSLQADAGWLNERHGDPSIKLSWLFIFDAFDEIPAILASTEEDDAVRKYAYALNDFTTRTPGCRAIVGSRGFQGPGRFGWIRYQLSPLSDAQRVELIERYLHNRERIDQLLGWMETVKGGQESFGGNPFQMAMLCAWFERNHGLPEHPHEVFKAFFAERFARGSIDLKKRGLTPEQVRDAAEAMAFCMSADTALDLEATPAQLRAALQRISHAVEPLPDLLDALCKLRLAKHGTASGNTGAFSFVHRRIQEFFATQWVLREPERASPDQLFSDYRWRETCVVLLQSAEEAAFSRLLDGAEARIDGALAVLEPERDSEDDTPMESPPASRDFVWPAGTQHVLGILQDGLRGRLDEIPLSLRKKVERLIWIANKNGHLLDRRMALEVAGLLPSADLELLLLQAFRSGSQMLADVAYTQTAWLRRLPDAIAAEIQRILRARAWSGELARLERQTRAHLLRLPNPGRFLRALERFHWVDPIDIILHLVWLAVALLCAFHAEELHHHFEIAWGVFTFHAENPWHRLLAGLVAVMGVWLSMRRAGGPFEKQRPEMAFRGLLPPETAFGGLLLIRAMMRGCILSVTAGTAGVPGPLALSLSFLVVSWEPYVFAGSDTGARQREWFLFPLWWLMLPRMLLRAVALIFVGTGLMMGLFFGFFTLLPRGVVTALTVGALILRLVIEVPLTKRAIKRWRRARRLQKEIEGLGPDSLEPKGFLDLLPRFETDEARVQFIGKMQRCHAVRTTHLDLLIGALRRIEEARALSRQDEETPAEEADPDRTARAPAATEAAAGTPSEVDLTLDAWERSPDCKRNPLASWNIETLDALGSLVASLQARQGPGRASAR